MKKLVMFLAFYLTVSLQAGTFIVTNTLDDGSTGSLRWAVDQCNLNSGPDTIKFTVEGVIGILTPLILTDNQTVIDGRNVAGDPFPAITITNPTGITSVGFRINGSRCVLKYLNIQLFTNAGVLINASRGHKIQGCYIGTNLNGMAAAGNSIGIRISGIGAGNIDIGDSSGANGRNVISGNTSRGISIEDNADSCRIVGNYIGLKADGTNALANNAGIVLAAGTKNNFIGLVATAGRNVISGNTNFGIDNSGVNLSVLNNIIGLDANGTVAVPNAGGLITVAKYTTIGLPGAGNIISGNTTSGIFIQADSATVQGNLIGTDITGLLDRGNIQTGIDIHSANANLIGGAVVGSRNIISGNDTYGIRTTNSNSIKIVGNYIGLNVNGDGPISNNIGIALTGTGSNFTVIGDSVPAGRNIISGNVRGFEIFTENNYIIGNFIGTNNLGTLAVPNSRGIHIVGKNNFIGTTSAGSGNVISGNSNEGIFCAGGKSNVILNNIIGLRPDGATVLANTIDGIGLSFQAKYNVIGQPGAGNIISGNGRHGINIDQSDSNFVRGNFIGTDVTGTLDKGNSQDGIRINLGMANQIGGNTAGSGNVVSGNNLRGVELLNARYNWIAGNYIGVNTSGTSAIANSDAGITSNGSKFNTIGDSTVGGRNVISGNSTAGIMLQNSSDSNQVIGNYIGLDKNGTTILTNGLSGNAGGIQVISNSVYNYIGSQSINGRNIISGNTGPGIRSDAKFTKILNNIIGLDASGTSAKPNTDNGIMATASGDFLTIGQANAGNIISGNQQNEIFLNSADSSTVQGNLIGTDITGTIDLDNNGHGILILGSTFDLIGGTSVGHRNIISGNSDGVVVQGGTYHKISGNYIGLTANGTTSLGNSQAGINLNTGASFITIGDTLTGGRNVISGNTRGVNIQDPTTKFNTVIGNYIGTNASGTDSVRNIFAGIDIFNGAKYNQIGNGNLSGRNLISGNASTNGIRVSRADSNEIKYNVIGATENGMTALWNKQGIEVDSSRGIVITRNIISGNTQHGVRLLNSAVASITHNVIGGAGVTGNGPLPNGQSGLFISTRSRVDYAIQNIIAYNSTYGILADGPATDSSIFYLNNIFKNGQGGISLQNGAQKNIAPPRITNVDYDGTVSGNAAPNASVQIYADSLTQNQGRYPLGTTNADASGNWSKQVGLMAGTILTALQDSAQNTSAFSSPFTFTSFTGSLSVLPSATIDFGTVIVGDTRNQTIQLTSENDNVRLHSIGSGLAAPFQMLTTITTPDTLILGVDTISASFSFTPSATGDFTDTVEFLTSGGIVNLILQGHAVPVGQITPLPSASIDFGNVAMGSSASQTIGLVATGNQTVIYPFTDVLALPFKLNATTTNLLDTLTPGVDTIRMQFSFEPTTTGNFKDTLLLPTSGGELPIILQGQGIQSDAAAPVLAIKLLRSTVAQQYVDIIVKANEDLSELNGSLTLGNTINVTPSKIGNSSQLFSTTYRLTEGTLNISMTGKDLAGNPATQTRNYTVAAFGKNYFSLKHSTMELTASNSSSPKSGFVMLTTVPHAATKGLSKSDVSSSWTQIGSKVQLFTTADFSEGQFLNLRSYYDQNEITKLKASHADFDERKIGLYQYSEENSSWMYLGGEGYQMQVNAKIAKAGEIAAFYNPDHVVLPKSLELSQNYPNPFNPTTTIRFGLPEESRVILSVYNILGQKIRELINDARTAGYYQINWDGKNESGLQAASGVYIYRLETVSGVKMKKMLLIK